MNDYEIDPVAASTSTPGPEKIREKLIIFDFNEMNIDDKSLTCLTKNLKSMKILILIMILMY